MDSSSQEITELFPLLLRDRTNQFDRPFPKVREPEEIGSFSITGPYLDNYHREYHDDRRGLRTLHRRGSQKTVRGLSVDLNQGIRSFVARVKPDDPQKDEHLEHLLRWILHHKQEFSVIKPNVDIVCWRGKIYELMCSPYERNNGWIMCACLVDGVIYMSAFETEEAKSRRLNATAREDACTYWGYKFEQVMLHDPTDKEALKEPVNNFDGFHVVMYSKVGDIGLLFGAEVDCIDPKRNTEKPPRCYAELKTSRKIDNDKQQTNFFRFKVMKWWAQSFIAGIPLILVGFRDDNGKVVMTDEIETKQISKLVKENGAVWAPTVCMNFLVDFFSYLRRTVKFDHTRAIYKFEWYPNWEHVKTTIHNADSEYKFIPDWYLDQRPK